MDQDSGSTHFPFCILGIILFSRVFFFPLFFLFVSFSLLLLNGSILCLEICTRVPVCVSKQLTIISSLLSADIIRIEFNAPGLKARTFYPLNCLTSLRSLEGSYSSFTGCTIGDVSFYFAVFKILVSSCLTVICLGVCYLKLLVYHAPSFLDLFTPAISSNKSCGPSIFAFFDIPSRILIIPA